MSVAPPCLDDFALVKVLGKGSYMGRSHARETHNRDGTVYAMNMLRKENVIKRNQQEHTKTERRFNLPEASVVDGHRLGQCLGTASPVLQMRGGSSFDRIFAREPGEGGTSGGTSSGGDGDAPSVHELFVAAMGDKLSLQEFARLLVELHGIYITPSAARLLSSVDAASGRLGFAQFQRALGEDGRNDLGGGAGLRTAHTDSASAIISDNCGAPAAPPPQSATKTSTDVTMEKEIFAKRSQEVSSRQRGAFSGSPVMPTNRVSAGNPLADRGRGDAEPAADADPYGTREMAQTATRMYVSGELDRVGFEKFLARFGVDLGGESELRHMIEAHERVGDGSFVSFSRALQRELEKARQGPS